MKGQVGFNKLDEGVDEGGEVREIGEQEQPN